MSESASTFQWVTGLVKSIFKSSSNRIVHPCVIDGQNAIVFEKGLRVKDPEFYARLESFAAENDIYLKEDRRNSFAPVVKERRRRVMPMMMLGASLLGPQLASAASGSSRGHDGHQHGAHSQIVDEHAHHLMDEEHNIKELMDWVKTQVQSLDVNLELPGVKRVNAKEMVQVAYGKDLPKAMSEKNLQIYGLYNYKNETIYLLDSIDLNSEKGKSILLHELVHYLQYQNGHDERVSCKNELEKLAYGLEARYLKEHGQRVDFSPYHVRRVSRCA